MSETAERSADLIGPSELGPPGGNAFWTVIRRTAVLLSQQREASVFVVAVALGMYFTFASSQFFTHDNVVNVSQVAAPWAIIAIGEVLLLVCGEMDLSVGFIYTLAPYFMHYLIDFYGVPAYPAVLLALLMGAAVGYINGFITVVLGVPSFITTLGTGFVLDGVMLTTAHAFPAAIPDSTRGIQHWLGGDAWSEIIWALVLVVYTPMFYAIAAAVIGGTAMAGGSGTIAGAFLGAVVLAELTDGFTILGISANPLPIILGGAILVAMIGNVYLTRLRRAGRT